MRRTRHVVLPVRSWQYVGLMVVSLACLTLGLISRDRGGRSGSLGGSELMHTAPHEVDACPNRHPFGPVFPYDESAYEKGSNDNTDHNEALFSGESEKLTLSNRRSIVTGRRTQRIDPSRVRIENSDRRTPSRILEVRKKGNSLLREKRDSPEVYRSGRTDRRARESSRSRERLSDRTSGSKSFDLRERSSSMIQREASDRYRRSSSVDRRNREASVLRDVSSQRQRLTSQPQERRFNEHRDDRVVKNRSIENQSLDRRIVDSDRKQRSRSVARRTVRLIRDNHNDQSSRGSRLYDDRSERRIENRRSIEQVRALVSGDQRRSDLTKEQSSEVNRIDIRRSPVRSQGRKLVERREENQRETRRNLADRSIKPKIDVRKSLSEDFDRVDARRMGSQERRMSRSEHQKREASTRSLTDRQSSRHNSDRVNAMRMRVRSEDRRSSTLAMNGERAWINSLRRDVRRIRNSEIRGYPERKERSATRDVPRERQSSTVNRFEQRQTLSMRSLPETARPERREHLAPRHISEGRRQDLSERTSRIAQELRTSEERRRTSTLRPLQQASRKNPELQRSTETLRIARILGSERSGRLTVRDGSQQRLGRPANRVLTRELETSTERRETSALRDSRRTSGRNSVQPNIGTSRISRTLASTRSGRLTVRDVSRKRLGRSIDRAITREYETSAERRETSNLRDSGRTFEMNSLQRDVRLSRVSRTTSSERLGRSANRVLTRELGTSTERRVTSNPKDLRRASEKNSLQHDVPMSRAQRITSSERLGRSANRVLTRELGTSAERRETSNLRDSKRTSERNSLQRDVPLSRASRITSSERLGRSADRILTREFGTSVERRETSNLRDSRRTSERDSQQRDIRRSRMSKIASSGRLIGRNLQTSDERRETSTVRKERDESSRFNSVLRNIRSSRISRNSDVERRERDVSHERRGRSSEDYITRELRLSRDQNSVNTRSERRTIEENRIARDEKNRQIVTERRERDVSQGRRGRFSEESITQKLRVSRGENGINTRSERRTIEENRTARDAKNRQIVIGRSRMSFKNIPVHPDVEKLSNVKSNEYLHQTLVLTLCAIYGASLLRGKGGFYSLRNIVNPANRFVLW